MQRYVSPSAPTAGEPYRVAVAGFSHETNTFATSRFDRHAVDAAGVVRGDDILRGHRGRRSVMAGYIEAADASADVELVPLLLVIATPTGLVTSDVFEAVAGELVAMLGLQAPLHALLLDLHGAGVSETARDMDGELLRRARLAVGDHTIIGVTLDMHANVSEEICRYADVVNLYQTNPHLDTRQRAAACGSVVLGAMRGVIRPVLCLIQLPLVVNILRQGTDDEPLRELLREFAEVEATDGTLAAGMAVGYPYADVQELGAAVVVVDDGDPVRAATRARALARSIWERRSELQGTAATAAEAARHAAEHVGARPLVLLDVGDNVGGGSHGDSTVLLHALRASAVDGVLCVLTDPSAVETCVEIGVGGDVSVAAGGRSQEEIGPPFELTGTVTAVHSGRFELTGPSHGGRPVQAVGPTAVVTAPGFGSIVLTARPFMPFSLDPYAALGIDVLTHRVIVAKGVIAPRTAFSPVAESLLLVDTPGPTTARFVDLPYEARRRPLYPFETDTTLDAAREYISGA